MTKTHNQKIKAQAAKAGVQFQNFPDQYKGPSAPVNVPVTKTTDGNVRVLVPARNKQLFNAAMVSGSSLGMAKARDSVSKYTKSMAGVAKGIVLSLCLPHEYPAVRLSDGFSGRPTAVANPYNISNVNVASGAVVAANKGNFAVLVFRDLLRSTISFTPSIPAHATTKMEYLLYYVNAATGAAPGSIWYVGYGATIQWPICYALPSVNSQLQLHGPVLYSGSHNGRKGIWVNSGEKIVITDTLTAMSTVDTCFVLYQLVGETWAEVQQVLATSTSGAAITITITGYYSLDVSDFRANSASVYMGLNIIIENGSSAYDGWSHQAVEDISDHSGSLASVRSIGVSLLLTNTAAVLNDNGNVAITQVDPGEDVASFCNVPNAYNVVSNDINAYAGPWEHGVYGFLKPSGPTDFDMRHPFRFSPVADQVLDSSFPLVPNSGFLIAAFTVSVDAGASTYSAGQGIMLVANSLEFATEDLWFSSIPPSVPSSAYTQALQLLKAIPQFHENPLHLSDIMNFLKKIGGGILDYAPDVLELAAAVNPALAPEALLTGGAVRLVNQLRKRVK